MPSNLDCQVLLPKDPSSSTVQRIVDELLERLSLTGYNQVALTHTVYGSVRPDDVASRALPETLWSNFGKKRKKGATSLVVRRRLHAVVENLADVGAYAYKAESDDIPSILVGYDLVGISPRNDAAFSAACSSASTAEIITLDYTAGRGSVQLPFKIRSADVKAAMERQAVFEIPYAPALLNRHQRKGLIQACRELQTASLGLKPRVIFSSGDRMFQETDQGALALRMPDDLVNLLQAVLRFNRKTSVDALSASALFAFEQGQRRRYGPSIVVSVDIDEGPPRKKTSANGNEAANVLGTGSETGKDVEPEEEEGTHEIEDGFIAF